MSLTFSVWFVIALALLAANLPFFSQRLFGLVALRGTKSLAVRLLELVVMYFLAGGVGLLLEHRAGQISPQGWEFYAITASLFVTLAFPGFVWRYLVNRES
ncbi:MAG: hypothetical protein RIS88_1999 [Pseudomonadota bacterium]